MTSVLSVRLDDGFPVTYAIFEASTLMKGSSRSVAVVLPGGVIDGRFRKGTPDGFEVAAGQRWIGLFDSADGLPGFYVMAFEPSMSMWRAADDTDDPALVDPYGHFVSALPCDGNRQFVVETAGEAATERGEGVDRAIGEEAGAMRWSAAVNAVKTCGGK